MGLLDRLLGRETPAQPPRYGTAPAPTAPSRVYDATPQDAPAGATPDEVAIARYRYLLRTAPPEQIEQAHAEAFAQLTPQQRQQVLGRLSDELPEGERPRSDQPADLARSATRAELRQPGFMQRSFGGGMGGMGAGMGAGGMIMTSMLGTIAGVVIGTAVADALFSDFGSSPEAADVGAADQGVGDNAGDGNGGSAGDGGGDAGGYDDAGYAGDPGTDASTDAGYDTAGYDGFGGDSMGGDFGGGDFGGGGFDGGFGDF